MSGPKRNPDKLNTIGVVVVGICGAVMVYVTIVALQAFYMNDTAEMQQNKDYGGMDSTAKGHKADEMRNITEAASNAGGTYRIPIEHAMELVVQDAEKDQTHLVPALPPSTKPTIEPQFGRPKPLGGPAPAEGGAAPAGAGSAAPAGAGSNAAPAGAPAVGAPGTTPAAAGANNAPTPSATPPATGAGGGATPATPAAGPGGARPGAGSAAGGARPAAGAAAGAAPQTPTGQGPGAAGASPGSAAAQPTRAGSAAPKHP